MSLVPTLELDNEHHHAQDTDASMRTAFNKDGCCTKHPDVLLRQRTLFGGWKILKNECHRCAEDWRAAREESQTRVSVSDVKIRQLKEEEAQSAAMYEKQMKDALGDSNAQITALRNRVQELQQENASLLVEVDRLRKEIDISTSANAEKVQALMDANAQLQKENETMADGYFSWLQNSQMDLSTQMQKMARDMEALSANHLQTPRPPTTQDTPTALAPPVPSSPQLPISASQLSANASQLPANIQQCHVQLDNARQQLVLLMEQQRNAEKLARDVELELRHDLSKVLQASEVDEKMQQIYREIDETGDVSKAAWTSFKDARLATAATKAVVDDQRQRTKELQVQLVMLHQEYDFVFTAQDDYFPIGLPDIRTFGSAIRNGLSVSSLRSIGYTAKEAKDAGCSLDEVLTAGYPTKEAVDAGYSLRTLRKAGFTAHDARDRGFSCVEVKDAGYSLRDMRDAGFIVFTNESLKEAVKLWVADRSAALKQFGHISKWVVSFVTSMKELFAGLNTFNEDISEWDVSRVTHMSNMFYGASSFNQPLDDWNVSQVTNMDRMFSGASSFDQPLDRWIVSQVTDMSNMFQGASSFNQPLDGWNVKQVKNMNGTFNGASSFNQPLNNWNVSQVTEMSYMFHGASSFDQPLNNWNVRQVTNMYGMFHGASSFNQPLSSWIVRQVTIMSFMFCGASSFNQPLNNWNVRQVTDMANMFAGASSFNQPLNNWNGRQVTNMSTGFGGASSFNHGFSTR